jgi:ATP-dependent Clp protease ATP-binding subunit ClpA
MFERFTAPARNVVVRAQDEARQLRQPYVGTEHLLLAMLSKEAGIAYKVLHGSGIDAGRIRTEIKRLVGEQGRILSEEDAAALRTIGIDLDAVLARIEESFGPDALQPPAPARRRGLLGRRRSDGTRFTPRAKKVLELSLREALRLKHNYIGTEHILLGLLREGEGLAAKILTDAGLTVDQLRRSTLTKLGEAA